MGNGLDDLDPGPAPGADGHENGPGPVVKGFDLRDPTDEADMPVKEKAKPLPPADPGADNLDDEWFFVFSPEQRQDPAAQIFQAVGIGK